MSLAPCCADRAFTVPALLPIDPDDPAALAREARRRASGAMAGVTDAHVHLFPESFYRSLRNWFDANAWSIAFRGDAEAVVAELQRIGTARVVALVYAHKPGVARYLNEYLGGLARTLPGIVGVGTVLPGEPDARAIVREAVDVHGLRGMKLHCHVQRLAIDDPSMIEILRECESIGIPAVVHAGREPAATGYGVDPRAICGIERTAAVLRALPRLKLVVPHVGADEFEQYFSLLAEHEGLYLDTSMSCAEYFAQRPAWPAIERWSHRVMYGTDFPIVPYETDRELRLLARRIENDEAFDRLVRGTAARVWGA